MPFTYSPVLQDAFLYPCTTFRLVQVVEACVRAFNKPAVLSGTSFPAVGPTTKSGTSLLFDTSSASVGDCMFGSDKSVDVSTQ